MSLTLFSPPTNDEDPLNLDFRPKRLKLLVVVYPPVAKLGWEIVLVVILKFTDFYFERSVLREKSIVLKPTAVGGDEILAIYLR